MIRLLARKLLPQMSGDWKADWPRLRAWLTETHRETYEQLNSQVQGVGKPIHVSGQFRTIDVTHPIHHISAEANSSIIWISLPAEQSGRQGDFATARAVSSFTGPLFLIPDDDNVRLVGGGNINPPTPLTLVKNQVLLLIFDGESWYPSAI